jgi:hypothetical protein
MNIKAYLKELQIQRELLQYKILPGARGLAIPSLELKNIQKQILQILQRDSSNYKLPYVFGNFKNNGGILQNASMHIEKPKILKLDIKDFFGSITSKNLEDFFKSYKILNNTTLFIELITFRTVLPKGAPTSPFIANMFL